MKFLAYTLIVTILIASAYANLDYDKINSCLKSSGTPCTTDCATESATQSQCVSDKCFNLTVMSDYANCIRNTCRTTNGGLSNYYDKLATCIKASMLSLSLMFTFVFAVLF